MCAGATGNRIRGSRLLILCRHWLRLYACSVWCQISCSGSIFPTFPSTSPIATAGPACAPSALFVALRVELYAFSHCFLAVVRPQLSGQKIIAGCHRHLL